MNVSGFDWDEGNIGKCQKHDVSIAEIESLFRGRPFVGPDPFRRTGERRLRAIGRTASGRPLFVAFTWRARDGERLIRPISARYMHTKEIEAYEKENPGL